MDGGRVKTEEEREGGREKKMDGGRVKRDTRGMEMRLACLLKASSKHVNL